MIEWRGVYECFYGIDKVQEKFVRMCFEASVKGKDINIIRYSSHALEEMDNDTIEEYFLEECMVNN
jgi:hypothetical protein